MTSEWEQWVDYNMTFNTLPSHIKNKRCDHMAVYWDERKFVNKPGTPVLQVLRTIKNIKND